MPSSRSIVRLPAPHVGGAHRRIVHHLAGVAAGDPDLWTAICRENRQAIRCELERLIADVQQLCQLLASEDDERLRHWLTEAKVNKDQTT